MGGKMRSFIDGFYTALDCVSGAIELGLYGGDIDSIEKPVTVCCKRMKSHFKRRTLGDEIWYASGIAFGVFFNGITFPLTPIVFGIYDSLFLGTSKLYNSISKDSDSKHLYK